MLESTLPSVARARNQNLFSDCKGTTFWGVMQYLSRIVEEVVPDYEKGLGLEKLLRNKGSTQKD